jgi:hypothetical protein
MKRIIPAIILATAVITAHAGPWTYSKTVDKMDPSYLQNNAVLSSTNKVNFSFPYNGGSRGFVVVNKVSSSRTDARYHIAFTVSKGQYICSMTCFLRIKFDNETPVIMEAMSDSDYKHDRLTLRGCSEPAAECAGQRYGDHISIEQFLSKLSSAKKLMIEASFYREGSEVFEFDTGGFKNL